MSWRASPSTGPGLITPGPCTAWPVWAAWGRAPPSTCSSTSTVGGKMTETPCWPLQVNYCWAQFTIWVNHSPFPCVIRPHGSSSSSHPGLCRLSGCRREPARQLFCGGGAGCGGGVHLGIPRTVGTTPPSTFFIRSYLSGPFCNMLGGASMRVTAAPRDDLLSYKLMVAHFFNRLGGPCTHKRASVQWMENQLARGPSLCSWWMRWGTSTRGPTPALPRTCKEPNQCPQMLKCCPSPNPRNHHQSDSEGEYGGRVKCCVTVGCAVLHNKIKCFVLETCYKLFFIYFILYS